MRRIGYMILLVLLVLTGCKDPVTLEGTGNVGVVVIDGKINTLDEPYTVKLGLTVGLDQKPNPLSFALITVYDDDAGLSEPFSETTPGVYVCQGAIVKGIPTHRYHITVSTIDGKQYASKPERIPDAVGTDIAYKELGTRSEFVNETEAKYNVVNVYVDSQLPKGNEKAYYLRWDVTETYMFEQTPIPNPFLGGIPTPCYVFGISDPQRITLFSTANISASSRNHTLVAQRDIDQSFLATHSFSVYQSSLTLECHRYWTQVDQLINRTGGIFDAPPAPITGNVFSTLDSKEQVFGYFEASNASLKRFYVYPFEITGPKQPYCLDPRYGIYYPYYPAECYGCTLLPNSTKTPPDWWMQDEE